MLDRVSSAKRLARKIMAKMTMTLAPPLELQIYKRYKDFTMILPETFMNNLVLCKEKAPESGCIIEAGVWRGGISAAIADMLPGRVHFLFDSFAGLPPAKEIDGQAALEWQRNVGGPTYFNNCRAERFFAQQAMKMSRAREFHLIEGWFSDTIAGFVPPEPIAILRLDADWYDSTMQCLTGLYPHVRPDGLVILDDYYMWDGCARALHDYLSAHKLADRIERWGDVCYLIKRGISTQVPSKMRK
jgi:O-methyltransferase